MDAKILQKEVTARFYSKVQPHWQATDRVMYCSKCGSASKSCFLMTSIHMPDLSVIIQLERMMIKIFSCIPQGHANSEDCNGCQILLSGDKELNKLRYTVLVTIINIHF
jgi:hypothetical protein